MEGIRLIKQALPDVRTILGISNVFFRAAAGAREVVNSCSCITARKQDWTSRS